MEKPVFVVGCDRSGTSLLTVMLDQSKDLKMIFESGFLPRLKKYAGDYGDFSQARQRWYFIRDLQQEKATSKTFAFEKFENLTDKEAEVAVRNAAPTDYRGAADALFSAAARKEGKSRWGEKMPRYVLQIPWLASTFPDSHIVHIIRDPRDVAASIRRAGWEDLRGAAESWKNRVTAGREEGLSLGETRYHEVKYESLLQNPAESLKTLAENLHINFDVGMAEIKGAATETMPESHREAYTDLFSNLDRSIDPSRAYAWRRELSQIEVADVESVAAPTMSTFGYEVSGARVPYWIQGIRWTRDMLIPVARRVKRRIMAC